MYKNLIFIITASFMLMSFTVINKDQQVDVRANQKSSIDNIRSSELLIQQKSVQAWVVVRGKLERGSVQLSYGQNGWKATSCSFSGMIRQYAQCYGQTVYSLNPNNSLAKQHNFTHFIETGGGKVYFRL